VTRQKSARKEQTSFLVIIPLLVARYNIRHILSIFLSTKAKLQKRYTYSQLN